MGGLAMLIINKYLSFMPRNIRHTMPTETDCPCNSGKLFKECCSPILADHSLAVIPEMLMRSRYTAFVVEDSAFLLRSWDVSTRPRSINFEKNIVWLKLIIEDAPPPLPNESTGSVVFQASFIQHDNVVEMKEKSVFLRNDNLWFYLNGELTTQVTAISLNEQCPCGSGKKYKRCCRL
jgi:SEC-C motif domain protein